MVMQSKPITPKQAEERFVERIPDVIIDAVNDLIAEKYSPINRDFTITQEEILERVCGEGKLRRADVFNNNWLDIEKLYRKSGWSVHFDKPGYCENYEPYFEFCPKRIPKDEDED